MISYWNFNDNFVVICNGFVWIVLLNCARAEEPNRISLSTDAVAHWFHYQSPWDGSLPFKSRLFPTLNHSAFSAQSEHRSASATATLVGRSLLCHSQLPFFPSDSTVISESLSLVSLLSCGFLFQCCLLLARYRYHTTTSCSEASTFHHVQGMLHSSSAFHSWDSSTDGSIHSELNVPINSPVKIFDSLLVQKMFPNLSTLFGL